MKKTMLIAPADDASLFAVEAKAAGCNIALGFMAKRPVKRRTKPSQGVEAPATGDAPATPDPGRIDFSWTPGSFVSSRALIIDTVNAFGGIEYAILTPSFPVRSSLAEATPSDIQKAIEQALTGMMLLSRELFSIENGNTRDGEPIRAAFVLRRPDDPDEVSSACFEAARAFAEAIAASRPGQCLCILDECPQRELGANFVVRALCAPALKQGGKPIRFTGKSGLFGIM